MKKYIIFDFDGTVINTNDVVIASWQETFRTYLGHEIPESEIVKTFGETLWTTLDRVMPGCDQDEVVKCYRDYQSAHADELVKECEGVKELLRELVKRGYKLAIATSRAKATYQEYADRFDLNPYFDVVVAMEDVTHHKPHPETVTSALEKLGAKPEEALMLGDTRFDILCSSNAGVESVFVGWSMARIEDIEASGCKPTYFIDKPMDLLDIITEK